MNKAQQEILRVMANSHGPMSGREIVEASDVITTRIVYAQAGELVESGHLSDEYAAEGNPPRRYFYLTPKGRNAVDYEIET